MVVGQALLQQDQLHFLKNSGLPSPDAVHDEEPVRQGGRRNARGCLAGIFELGVPHASFQNEVRPTWIELLLDDPKQQRHQRRFERSVDTQLRAAPVST